MDDLVYNERTGEFVKVNGYRSKSSLFFVFLGIICVALTILGIMLMYNKGVFDNDSSSTNKQNELYMNMHGRIGEYPVTMQLTISGSVVEGTYFYDRGSSTLILSGTNDDGDITLHETTAQGRPTGLFQGRLSNGEFKGRFTNSRGEKFSFIILKK